MALIVLPDSDLKFIRLVLIARGGKTANRIDKEIGEMMGKGSGRRPEDKNKFDSSFDKIFGKPEKKKKPYKTEPDYPPIKKDKV